MIIRQALGIGVVVALSFAHPAGGATHHGANTVFPGKEWASMSAQSQRVNADKLAQAIEFLESHSGNDGVSELMIIRNGYAIWQGPEVTKVHGIWSGTKSFVSTCLGLLIEDARCQLSTRAADWVPEMRAAYPEVTLRHFATMTSGYRAQGDEPRDGYAHGPSRTPFLPAPTPLFMPGSQFAYWDSAMNQFSHVLTRIAKQPLEKLFQQRIANPIQMNPDRWRWGAFESETGSRINGGAGNNSNHLYISASEMARFGWLFLNRGRWNGQQLIATDWVEQATNVQVAPSVPLGHKESGIAGPGVYGFNWWRNGRHPEGTRKWPGAPTSTFAASGYNNNDLFVIPDWNMVVVRLGLDQGDHKISDEEYGQFLAKIGDAIDDTTLSGEPRAWHPVTLSFRGPEAKETDSKPNPFLDYRLAVEFTGPDQSTFTVPGFFDGRGNGEDGRIWKVRFTPHTDGRWHYKAHFHSGPQIAIDLNLKHGEPLAFHGTTGSFEIAPRNPDAKGFHRWGRLEYTGEHYLKFRDGPYWIRGGTDSPENFLAFSGFDNTPASHRYTAHEDDWLPGDPDWNQGKGRAIIGALNSLAEQNVNSLYFLTMNIGGDGGDVWPWTGKPNTKGSPENDNLHFDLSKLQQWNQVFDHAQKRGIFLHFVLNEAERANKTELDNGELGVERKLYYREMIARFGHHLALEWNLCEEYNIQFDFGANRIRAFADYIQQLDPYDHPITVHSAGDPEKALAFTFGDSRFSMTSVQINQRRIDTLVESLRKSTARRGRRLPISMDEFTVDVGQEKSWLPADRPDLHRKTKLWPTYFSGGMIEFILEDLLEVESFKTPERKALWNHTAIARHFMEDHLPFWRMQAADEKVLGETTISVGLGAGKTFELGAQVFDLPGVVTAIYYPNAFQLGRVDLSDFRGRLRMRWFNPRTGAFEGQEQRLTGGFPFSPNRPPRNEKEDWVMLIQKT